jgi:hypothetical protein
LLGKIIKLVASVALLLVVCAGCFLHPVPDYFDRLIYEAIILGKSRPIEAVYDIVKHENPRAEASSVLNSPEHLRELEPLYAIRPLYLEIVCGLSFLMPLRRAIDFASAAPFFLLGIVAMIWTARPFLSALLMSAYPLLVLARIGGPDAMSALFLIGGLCLIEQPRWQAAGLLALFLSLGVRTDNVLPLLAALAWCAWEKRFGYLAAGALALLAIGVVWAINTWVGNYGWVSLFHYSFIGQQASAAHVPRTITIAQYFAAVFRGAAAIAVHVTLWILLGILAWMRRANGLLLIVAVAAIAHFLLYPSPEDRYFVWAYILVGIVAIRTFARPSNMAPWGHVFETAQSQ